MAHIAEVGTGVVVYLRNHEGPAHGLLHELHTDRHHDHAGDDGLGAQILADLGVSSTTTRTRLARLA